MKHGRSYGTSSEEGLRKIIFTANLRYIQSENANPENTYRLAANKFADFSQAEFSKIYLGLKPKDKPTRNLTSTLENETLPLSVDRRTKGAVTPVKDQGQCGSCWTFSTTGSLEGGWFQKSGKLQAMSEQQLVDCDRKSDEGCNGGEMEDAFNYIKQKGIEVESTYPYKGVDKVCKYSKGKTIQGLKVAGYTTVRAKSENALKAAIAKTTVAVSIDANKIMLYDSGFFNNKKCGHDLDHGVLGVGYGSEKGNDYWLIKNSWNEDWGEKGYIWFVRHDGTGKMGICGITEDNIYPNLS